MKGNWIDFSKEQPKEDGFYLVCHDGNKIFKCDTWDGNGWMDLKMTKLVNQFCESEEDEDYQDEYEITHWMELPEPPKQG